MRQFAEGQTLLSNAIRLGNNLPAVYINRALCYRALRDDQSALADISVVLQNEKLSERDLIFVNRRLVDLEPSAAYQVEQAPALDGLTPNAKVQLASDMMRSREALPSAIRILRRTQQSAPVPEQGKLHNVLILCLIASQQYKEAIAEIERVAASNDDVA
jgi:tetratricopeptide (TPR) repeat protein